MSDDHGYFAADAPFDDEHARLRLLEEALDPSTVACLQRLGVERGWICAEVGAGAGSIATWLGERVGPVGHVLAIDIDTRHLQWIDSANVNVQVHDIVSDSLGAGSYDLVHCRALLEHVRDPDRAIRNMVAGLRPRGCLLAEGGDLNTYRSVDRRHPLARLFDTGSRKLVSFVATAGIFDPFICPSLPERLNVVGLEDIETQDLTMTIHGGSPMAVMFELTWQRFDPVLRAQGVLSDDEISARHDALYDDSFSFVYGRIAAWGRHP
jgi:SAM-dependent methyltransferase